MARKKRYGSKRRKTKSRKRVLAGRKAARTRKLRYGAAGRKRAKRVSRKSTHRRGHRRTRKHGHAARVRAGRRAWAAKVRKYGSKAAAIAATFGKRRRRGKKSR